MTRLPIDELQELRLTSDSGTARPFYNEKVRAVIHVDETHVQVIHDRCLGSAHSRGVRIVNLEASGPVWRIANEMFVRAPDEITSAKGMPAADLPCVRLSDGDRYELALLLMSKLSGRY